MVCSQCGAPLEGSKNFCQYCGTEIQKEKNQGKKIYKDKIKNIINKNINPQVINETISYDFEDRINKKEIIPKKNKGITILLMLTLGFFGGHKFYLGDIKYGIIYMGGCIIGFTELMMFMLCIGLYPEWLIPVLCTFPKYFYKVALSNDIFFLLYGLLMVMGPAPIMGIGAAILRDLFNYCFMDKVQWCNMVGYIEKK